MSPENNQEAPKIGIHLLAAALLMGMIILAISPEAVATTATTGTAFDGPLETLRGVFTGPIAYTAALLGIVVAGAMLVFGGEIGEFAKRLIMLVLVIAVVVLAATVLTDFFGTGAAVLDIP